jgi:hypothetical protein
MSSKRKSSSASNNRTFNDALLSSVLLHQQRLIGNPTKQQIGQRSLRDFVHVGLLAVRPSRLTMDSSGIFADKGHNQCSFGSLTSLTSIPVSGEPQQPCSRTC